jgi:riboflavin synthase
MFTGLIETTGTVVEVVKGAGAMRITISAPSIAPRLALGDSVAVSGVCLTALDITPPHTPVRFSADLAEETIARTTLSHLFPGSVVNLELPTPAGSPLGGHVVQGHVDGTGTLLSLNPVNPDQRDATDWKLRLYVPPRLAKYIAPQGSITVDGISLTVADITGNIVSIAIIPHTYAATSLRTLLPSAPLNIEVDVLAKYAERRAQEPHMVAPLPVPETEGFTVTESYLIANGY